MPKLTVCIPAYNAAEHLTACLDSVLNQSSWEDVEVLVANDGSTDNTEEILKKYVAGYPNVHYFSKPNSGLTATRNFLAAKVTTDWVMWMDADDYITEGTIAEILKNLKEDPDVIILGFTEDPSRDPDFSFSGEAEWIRGKESLLGLLTKDQWKTHLAVYPVWGKVLKTSLLKEHGILSDEKAKIGEDIIFTTTYYRYVETACLLNRDCYRYCRYPGSMSAYGHSLSQVMYSRPIALKNFLKIFENTEVKDDPRVYSYGYETVKVIIVNILREKKISLKEVTSGYRAILTDPDAAACIQKGSPAGLMERVIHMSLKPFWAHIAAFFLYCCNKLFGRNYKGF